jgi:hypothetical protein
MYAMEKQTVRARVCCVRVLYYLLFTTVVLSLYLAFACRLYPGSASFVNYLPFCWLATYCLID